MASNPTDGRRYDVNRPDPELGSFEDNMSALDQAEQALRDHDFERAHRLGLAVVSRIDANPEDSKSARLLHGRAKRIVECAFDDIAGYRTRRATHESVSAWLKTIEALISEVLDCAGIVLVRSIHFGLLAYGLWRVLLDVLRNLHG